MSKPDEETCDNDVKEDLVILNKTEADTKVKKGWSKFYITIEPIKFCLGFTIALTGGVIIDLLQRNICYRDYNLSYDECQHLSNTSVDIKANVESATATMNMVNNLAQGICPLFLVVFIGPWSDKNGRKPFILWAIRGYMAYTLLWFGFSMFPHLPVVYFFIPSIPLGCTGAAISIYVCTWSYTCDNFEAQDRTMRFTISTGTLIGGMLVGNFLASPLMHLGGERGFQIVFATAFFVNLLSHLYAKYILEETVVCKKSDREKLFNFSLVKSIVMVLVKPEKGKWMITFVLLVLFTEIPAYAGDEAIIYMVGKSQYNWSLARYNAFNALASLLSGGAPILAIWLFMDIFKIKNETVLLVACVAQVALHFLKAMSVSEEMFWTISMISRCWNIIGPTIDSELVEAVSEENVGKAFTFTSIMDALSPIMAVPIYTLVYKFFLPDKTLYVYFLTFGLSVFTLLGSIGLLIKKRSLNQQTPTETMTTEDDREAAIAITSEKTEEI